MAGDLASGITVDGEPLGFYHFTGFDSGAHAYMADKYARRCKPVRELVDWYQGEMASARDATAENTQWAYRCYSNGEAIQPCHRALYRDRKDLRHLFPDPFDASGDGGFLGWIKTRGPAEYPAVLTEAGDCKPDARALQAPVVNHGCLWWLKRLIKPDTFLLTARYMTRRLSRWLSQSLPAP